MDHLFFVITVSKLTLDEIDLNLQGEILPPGPRKEPVASKLDIKGQKLVKAAKKAFAQQNKQRKTTELNRDVAILNGRSDAQPTIEGDEVEEQVAEARKTGPVDVAMTPCKATCSCCMYRSVWELLPKCMLNLIKYCSVLNVMLF